MPNPTTNTPSAKRCCCGAVGLSGAADDQRVALAAAAAEGGRANGDPAAAHLVGEGEHEPRAARADRVAEGHRAAVHVDPLLVEVEHPGGVERHRREGFIDLDQV